MQHFSSLEDVQLNGAYATIGTFDGVHLGHQAILRQMSQAAHAAGRPAVVVTFYPHPLVVLRNLQIPYYLSTPQERAELLGQAGIDVVVTLTFDRVLAALSAREFMGLLRDHLGLSQLWAGFNFALGRNREGDIPALERLGEEMGYRLHVIPPVSTSDAPISSSLIRSMLGEGKVAEAARLLGRRYAVSGTVIHGDGRGRTIGVPTANLDVWPEQILPANGIYACWAMIEGQPYRAATNVGFRPTFANRPPSPRVEAHLLNFTQDLYGKNLCLEFVHYLRPEEKYATIQALVDQIKLDINQTVEVLERDR